MQDLTPSKHYESKNLDNISCAKCTD